MVSGRAMLLPRMRRMSGALREQLPPFVPHALRGALSPIAAVGVAHLMRKYGVRRLAAEYPDLLAWRDRLYGRWRGPQGRRDAP